MKRAMHFGLIGWLALTLASPLVAQPFTYQGFLKDSGSPANGIYDFRFILWTAPSGGVQVGPELYVDDVSVQNGLFTVQLDFGAVWDGSDRYLEILVRLNDALGYWLLTPRVKITPTPYASFAQRPWQTSGSNIYYNDGNVGIGTSSPAERLHIVGNLRVDNGEIRGNGILTLRPNVGAPLDGVVRFVDAAGNEKVRIHWDGFVGIGTNFPYAPLSMGGGNANTKIALWQGPTTYDLMGLGVGPNQFRLHLHNASNRFSFLDAPNGNEIVTILGTGDVRINGDTNFSTRLYVFAGDDRLYGVLGVATQTNGIGVSGRNNGTGAGTGVYGRTNSTTSSLAFGVLGEEVSDGAGHAVYAYGSFAATGTKSFQIDHPLDPENYYLNHFCVEAPEPLNTYSGVVVLDARGEAWVQLPPYFEAINRDPRYTLTPIGAPMPNLHVAVKIQNNRFKIAGGTPGQEVSWEVKAVRNDLWVQRYGYQTEQEKEDAIKGKYLNPELYGQPKERGIHHRPELEPTHNKETTKP